MFLLNGSDELQNFLQPELENEQQRLDHFLNLEINTREYK